ncbi:glycyl radical protein [Fusibacter paucivorans]|uniref:Glycyl radical protein n=1 Tax=Fusibacter paucivorans TaxID=76009 RepID=A0ABS5PSH4_9FIRM|nr:trans-4-hydroxy-L-proline dehydratase [Fusibacter paucivorans]MBS7527491.1 glycyl radical protein [Fusibacter paucivorans]
MELARGSTKRTQYLRAKSTRTQPRLDMERAIIYTEIYKKYMGVKPPVILRAMAFKRFMETRTLYFGDRELIVGEKGKSPQSAPTFPDLCCHTLEDLDIMSKRQYISFKVSDDDKAVHTSEIIPFWAEKSMRHKILSDMTPDWHKAYKAGVFTEFMEQRAPGHTVADDKMYHNGFLDFKARIEKHIEQLDYLNDSDAVEKRDQLEAMVIACDAIILLGKRYAEMAESKAAAEHDPQRKSELLAIAANCRVVPSHKPETFAQALQMYWFVHLGVTTELNTWDAFSPGKLDQYLYPFYQHDVAKGILTRESAQELLECLWIKFNNQPAPPKVGVTLKESATYTDFANINTGGLNPNTGESGVNDVSFLILDVMDEMKLLQPSSNVQINRETPSAFIKRACEISRKGWGQPAFYNTEELIQELMNAGKSYEDALYGGSSGCVETGCAGKEAYILTGYFNLPKVLELTLSNGYDFETKEQVGIKILENGQTFESFDALFDGYKRQLQYLIDIKIEGNQIIEKRFAKQMQAPFLSIIVDDCIESGKDYNNGGARYNTRYIQGVGIGTIADSLSAIKFNVFDKQHFSLQKLMTALDHNFEGYEMLHKRVLKHTPKYGNDNDYADNLMQQAFQLFYDAVTNRPTACGGVYRIDMLPTTCHVYFGSVTRASANGRKAYIPLPDGISPEKGADINGPTAVIKSASKMDHAITGGTLLNQKFAPNAVAGEKGLDLLSAFVRSYFLLGGHHIQFNIIDRALLIEAQKDPEAYSNLIVRVAGYSDHFNNLEKALQDEIIYRTEHQAF